MEIAVTVLIALLVAAVTLVLCDLAGSIARSKGRSYWLFFGLGLLLWFPALIAALVLPDRSGGAAVLRAPGRGESGAAALLLAVAVVALAAAVFAAVSYAA